MENTENFIKLLQEKVSLQETVIHEKDETIKNLQEMICLLIAQRFARRSEKNITPNGDIFNDISNAPPDEVKEDTSLVNVPAHQRAKPKRKPLPVA